MKIKTSDLTGAALDWAAAKAEGYSDLRANPHRFAGEGEWIMTPPRADFGPVLLADLRYSRDWSQGGPIIERESIGALPIDNTTNWSAFSTHNKPWTKHCFREGPTPLTAAMRCFVASRLGDEVEVPEELA